MNQWIYVLKVTRLEMLTEGSTPEEDEIVGRHFAYLKDLTEKGVMILMGRTQTADESTFGSRSSMRKMKRLRERSWRMTQPWPAE